MTVYGEVVLGSGVLELLRKMQVPRQCISNPTTSQVPDRERTGSNRWQRRTWYMPNSGTIKLDPALVHPYETRMIETTPTSSIFSHECCLQIEVHLLLMAGPCLQIIFLKFSTIDFPSIGVNSGVSDDVSEADTAISLATPTSCRTTGDL